MAERPSFLDFGAWSTRTWVTALVAGIVALILFLLFGASFFWALVIGVLVFLAVAWWLQRDAEVPTTAVYPTPSPPAAPRPVVSPAPAPPPPVAPAPPPVAEPLAAAAMGASRPTGLSAARDGEPDDLKKIKGVGPKLQELLYSLGYYHFDQIAAWTATETAWVDSNLEGFNGRATRDDWVGQAKILAAGGTTEFSERVDKGEVYD